MSLVALAWVLHSHRADHRGIEANHIEDAMAALSLKLTAEDIASLEEPRSPRPVLGFS